MNSKLMLKQFDNINVIKYNNHNSILISLILPISIPFSVYITNKTSTYYHYWTAIPESYSIKKWLIQIKI